MNLVKAISFAAALMVLLAFGWLCYFMVTTGASTAEQQKVNWDHLVVVFNSLQTMAAAALGVLLGTTVQQSRVDAADANAKAARASADANAGAALKINAVADLVRGLQAPGAAPDAADTDGTVSAIRAILAR